MSQAKKIVLIAVLFVYTIFCGIIIADTATSSVAGSDRPNLMDMFLVLL